MESTWRIQVLKTVTYPAMVVIYPSTGGEHRSAKSIVGMVFQGESWSPNLAFEELKLGYNPPEAIEFI